MTTPSSHRAQALLLDFLSDHDAACPVCGYNLKGLTRPVCPECKQELVLSVSAGHLRLTWLFIALVPGFFSGIAACFAAIPTTGIYFEEGELVPPFVFATLFGWCSGMFAILLAFRGRNRNRFLVKSIARQRWFAAMVWIAHAAAFALFVFLLAPYWN